ncbi:12312_t:CDS:2 [Acaulospora colombiana]|uniref:12312_t:CDS:1 n=1 Tax=Acaulospora colombiana TaxID=27376 RepID=A0ACA9KL58_9GLOM|nr:12312_t:CDS:2 [Acaulospora colombiana]
MGIVAIIGSDELLACFVAGNSFTWDDWFRMETVESHFQPILDMLLNLAVFAYIGAIMPFSSFADVSLGLSYWRLIVMATLIILFRRVPIVMALMKKIPALKTYREGLFAGWFGPIGVGAVFYGELTREALVEYDALSTAKDLIKPSNINNVIKLDGTIIRRMNTQSVEKIETISVEAKDFIEPNNSSSSSTVREIEQTIVSTSDNKDDVVVNVGQGVVETTHSTEITGAHHDHDDIIEEQIKEDQKTRVIPNPP